MTRIHEDYRFLFLMATLCDLYTTLFSDLSFNKYHFITKHFNSVFEPVYYIVFQLGLMLVKNRPRFMSAICH